MAAAPNIGDLLLEWGAITSEQLTQALARQREHGGRLGAALVELGFVDEKTLTSALARQLSIPSVTPDQIDRVPGVVAQLVPGQVAARLRVVPVREDAGRLWIAMSDPTDKAAVDEIAKLTRRPVRTMVASERLVERALGKYYGITTPKPGEEAAAPGPELEIVLQVDVTEDAAAEITRYLEETPSVPAPPKAAPVPGPATLAELAVLFANNASDEAVVDAALSFLARDVTRLCAFAVRQDQLVVWRTRNVDPDPFKRVHVSVEDLPRLKRGLESGEAYAGRVESFALGGLAAPLGLMGDTLGVVVPVRVAKLPIGCIVGLDASLDLLRRKRDLDRLAVKIDQALHMNYLRRVLLQG